MCITLPLYLVRETFCSFVFVEVIFGAMDWGFQWRSIQVKFSRKPFPDLIIRPINGTTSQPDPGKSAKIQPTVASWRSIPTSMYTKIWALCVYALVMMLKCPLSLPQPMSGGGSKVRHMCMRLCDTTTRLHFTRWLCANESKTSGKVITVTNYSVLCPLRLSPLPTYRRMELRTRATSFPPKGARIAENILLRELFL